MYTHEQRWKRAGEITATLMASLEDVELQDKDIETIAVALKTFAVGTENLMTLPENAARAVMEATKEMIQGCIESFNVATSRGRN